MSKTQLSNEKVRVIYAPDLGKCVPHGIIKDLDLRMLDWIIFKFISRTKAFFNKLSNL